MKGRRIILVLQMAKVASQAWYNAIKSARPDAEVHHLHYLNPMTIEAVRARNNATGSGQTVANMPMVRLAPGLPTVTLEAELREAIRRKEDIKILSGIRDPIDRAASQFFYFADYYGHRTLGLSHRQNPSVADLVSYFVENWRHALAGASGQGTFEDALQAGFVRYRDWFEHEITEVFSIEIRETGFDPKRSALLADSGPFQLFVYRFEDLPNDTSTWARLSEASSIFLDARIDSLPKVNATDQRRARNLYAAFKQAVKLPRCLIEEIYSPPIIAKFYRADEIATMKSRWSE